MCAWNVTLRRMFYPTKRATLATNAIREKTLITSWIITYTRFGLKQTKMGQPKWIHQGGKNQFSYFPRIEETPCYRTTDHLKMCNNCTLCSSIRWHLCVKRTLCYISKWYHPDVWWVITKERNSTSVYTLHWQQRHICSVSKVYARQQTKSHQCTLLVEKTLFV